MIQRYAAVTGRYAIGKMAALAERGDRVQVTRDAGGWNSQFDVPEWSIEAVLYCDDPDNPQDPETYWTLGVGHDNTNPWMGASLSFRTKHVLQIEYVNTRPEILIR